METVQEEAAVDPPPPGRTSGTLPRSPALTAGAAQSLGSDLTSTHYTLPALMDGRHPIHLPCLAPHEIFCRKGGEVSGADLKLRGAAASMSSKKSLLNGATAGDAYRVRITLAGMRATAGWVVNSLTDKAGTPLLTLAVRSGSAETVQHLLKVRADPTKATGQAGDTPLLVLAQGRRSGEADKETLAIAKLLIDAKANVNFVNAFSQTALYQCSGRKDTALAQYLIHRGANANF
ncbi:hypothetical protein T484DRAFT_1922272, partial [Baffinella frigidus]